MPPKNNHSTYTLYKKPTKEGLPVWYARFWDEVSQRYAVTRSTGVIAEGKRERKAEAEECARAMLPDIKFKVTVGDMLSRTFCWISGEKPATMRGNAPLSIKRPLCREYSRIARQCVQLHVLPFLKMKNIVLDDLTPAIIRDWVVLVASKGMSANNQGEAGTYVPVFFCFSMPDKLLFCAGAGASMRFPRQSVISLYQPYRLNH